ncbi:2138_t:CDS:2 [Cetraspora pellucida]|uniref:2138_t:CDS:1 n=1 Tax=Cetraspora pellucida TaxID=1433469 RepID=A0A9N9F4H1_9GLOM|nr:2138_t:CDS:2 [Cetraspora pellucida]
MSSSKNLHRIFMETYHISGVLSSDLESWADGFARLLSRNKELTEQDKKIIQEWSIEFFEGRKVRDKVGKQIECLECNSIKYSNMYCENCMRKALENQFNKWTSGNEIIDSFIQTCQLETPFPNCIIEWIPFDLFEDVKYLAEGGFGKVYTAIRTRGPINNWDKEKNCFTRFGAPDVVLKSFNNSEKIGKSYLKEAQNYNKLIRGHFASCCGITKNPDNNKYMMVMRQIQGGNLREYLRNNNLILSLKQKIRFISDISNCICEMHKLNLIHKDLHSGNILIYDDVEAFITDLGTSLAICDGVRPPILPHIPESFIKLIEKCWNKNSYERPEKLRYAIKEEYKKLLINEEYHNKILNVYNLRSYSIPETNKYAFHTSRILDEILNELHKTREFEIDILSNDITFEDKSNKIIYAERSDESI